MGMCHHNLFHSGIAFVLYHVVQKLLSVQFLLVSYTLHTIFEWHGSY